MSQVTIEYFGFSGTGRTVKEAKQDAGRQIEQLQRGTWHPEIITWKNCAMLVYRTLHGWNYSIIQSPERPLQMPMGSSSSQDDRAETIRQARRHLVDLAWQVGDPIEEFPEWIDEDQRKEMRSSRQWHINYKQARDQGKTDEEAREFAFFHRYKAVTA